MRKITLYCITVVLMLTLFSASFVFQSFATADEVTLTNRPLPDVTLLPGYCTAAIKLDFSFSGNDALLGFVMSTATRPNMLRYSDEEGVIRASNLTNDLSRFVIQKPGYLSHTVDLPLCPNTPTPVEMWAGDVNGDNAINMVDIMRVASFFNCQVTNEVFEMFDFNTDRVINLRDIMIVAAHFGKTSSDYPMITRTYN
jgi:hypothetical protein